MKKRVHMLFKNVYREYHELYITILNLVEVDKFLGKKWNLPKLSQKEIEKLKEIKLASHEKHTSSDGFTYKFYQTFKEQSHANYSRIRGGAYFKRFIHTCFIK